MAKIHITNVVVLDNPSSFFNPFQFELTFECIEELKEDLEWKMIYVGSAESEDYDQILDTIYVGPVPEGRHIFVFQADAPDVSKIPEQDVVGVTIILLTCSYRGQEFVRVGYYVNNDYVDPEMRENPPCKPIYNKLVRNILASKPRVTRFKINWDDGETTNNSPCSSNSNAMTATQQVLPHFNNDTSLSSHHNGSAGANNDIDAATSAALGGIDDFSHSDSHQSKDMFMDDSNSLPVEDIQATHNFNDNSNSVAMEC